MTSFYWIAFLQWPAVSSVAELFDKGGAVLMLIALLALVLLLCSIERLWFLRLASKPYMQALVAQWQARSEHSSWRAQQQRNMLLSRYQQSLRANLALIKVLIMICPMLGLLGTVTGMIAVFDVLAYQGAGNARLMAAGISQATIPTMAGMVIAIVALPLRARLERLVKLRFEDFSQRLILT